MRTDRLIASPSDTCKIRATFLLYATSFLVYFLPLKFATITGVPEIAFLPEDPMSWLIFTYPPVLFSIVSGSALVFAVILLPFPKKIDFRMATALLFFSLACVSLLGAISASVWDFPILQICHFFGIASFAFLILYLMDCDERTPTFIGYAILLSCLTLAVLGVHQIFWGFKESLDYINQEELRTGVKISENIRGRLLQTRVFTTFSLCNSYAAHLILTVPFVLVFIWKSRNALKVSMIFILTGAVCLVFPFASQPLFFLISFLYSTCFVIILFRFPEQLEGAIRIVTVAFLAAAFAFNLYFTGSRAAVLTFGIAVATLLPFMIYAKSASIKKTLLFLATAVIATILFYFLTANGRTLDSLIVRLDYSRVALKLFFQNPLFGTGWGDFFHSYPISKTFPGEEAPHDPHSFLLSFASQTGIVGFLIALSIICMPLVCFTHQLVKTRKLDALKISIIIGWTAWIIHSFLDINFQIAGTVSTAVCLLMIMDTESPYFKRIDSMKITSRQYFKMFWFCAIFLSLGFSIILSAYRLDGEFAFLALQNRCEPRFTKEQEIITTPEYEIEKLLEECSEKMPYSPYPWATAGNFFQICARWKLSESCFESAVKLSPERASYHYRLAYTQIRIGKRKEALENLEIAARLFPGAQYGKILENIREVKTAPDENLPPVSEQK